MPARHTLHVALTEPLVQHVRDQVTAGRHVNASEVVRRALQLLIDQEGAETNQTVSSLRKILSQLLLQHIVCEETEHGVIVNDQNHDGGCTII